MTYQLKTITFRNNITFFRIGDDGQREVLCDVVDTGKQETIQVFIKSNLLLELGFLAIANNEDMARHFNKRIYWSEEASTFLRKKYDEYAKHLGPGKRFTIKKDIWNQISIDLFCELSMIANWKQVQNRYKSSIRNRKKSNRLMPQNSLTTAPIQSGHQTVNDTENNSKPEVPENRNKVCILNNLILEDVGTQTYSSDFEPNLINTLMKIETSENEENERRHEEQIELIESIISRMTSTVDEPSSKVF